MMLHHGFVIAGLPYAFAGQMGVSELSGAASMGEHIAKLAA